jgi:hypothetical protein
MTPARLDKILAVGVVAGFLLAVACFGVAQSEVFRGAMAQMSGLYAREFDPLGASAIEADARRAGLEAFESSRRFDDAGGALLVLAGLATAVAALRTYQDWRSWHWLSFAAFGPALGAAWFASGRWLYNTGSSRIWIPVACATTLACGFDLRRSSSAGPGRIVAWFVLALGVVAGAVLAITSLRGP